MGRKRNIPKRNAIFNYWKDKINKPLTDNTCFKCGLVSQTQLIVERAHIKAVCEGGSDDLENIHLLCRYCHKDSEAYSGDSYNLWFKSSSTKEFNESLYLLWDANNINISESLSNVFKGVKDNFIRNNGIESYNSQIDVATFNNIRFISHYLKSL